MVVQSTGAKLLVAQHPALLAPLVAGLARGLSCPDGYVAECAAAAVAIFVDCPTGRGASFRTYLSSEPTLTPQVGGPDPTSRGV